MGKVKKLMKCVKVRSMKADFTSDRHYGIELGARITESQVLAIVLYADYERLSLELARTFMADREDEQLFSVKQRNAEFAHWCRLLREV